MKINSFFFFKTNANGWSASNISIGIGIEKDDTAILIIPEDSRTFDYKLKYKENSYKIISFYPNYALFNMYDTFLHSQNSMSMSILGESFLTAFFV